MFPSRGIDSVSIRGAIACGAIVVGAVAWTYSLISFWHAKEFVFMLALPLLALGAASASLRAASVFSLLILGLLLSVLIGSILELPAPEWLHADALRFGSWLAFAVLTYDLCWRRPWRERIKTSIIASGAIAGLLALLQWAKLADAIFPAFAHYTQPAYSVFGNQNFLGGYTAICLPLALSNILRNKAVALSAAASLLLLAALLISESRSAWLAATVGVGWMILTSRKSSNRTWLIAGLAAAVVVLIAAFWSPLADRLSIPFHEGDVGGRARLWFWDTTRVMIADHPLLGVGLGQYRAFSPRYGGLAYERALARGQQHYHNEIIIEHAHSVPLELWAELGIVALLVVAWLLRRSWRFDKEVAAGLITLVVFSLFNASIHCAPFAIVGLIYGGMLSPPSRYRRQLFPRGNTKAIRAGLFTGGLLALVAHVAITLYPGYLLRHAHAVHLARGDAQAAYEEAIQWRWGRAEANFYRGIALLEAGQYTQALEALKAATPAVDTGDVYYMLAAFTRALGEDARAYEEKMLERWPWRKENK